MNKHLVSVFTASIDNRIVCFETNLKAFHAKFEAQVAPIGNYQSLYRKFNKSDHFNLEAGGKVYWFQKLS
jgi:hypothetical protein